MSKSVLKGINVQLEHQFPGLVQECLNHLKQLKLQNINLKNVSKNVWKNEVKKAIKIKNEEELRNDIGKLEKVKEMYLNFFLCDKILNARNC